MRRSTTDVAPGRAGALSLRWAGPWRVSGLDLALGALFLLLFWSSLTTLVGDWWRDPESDRGLLLGPLAIHLAWRRGIAPSARPQPVLGTALLAACVVVRYLSELAVDRYTLRISMVGAAVALVVFFHGFRQIVHWWISLLLILLVIPLPNGVWTSLSLPLQLKSAEIGAALLAWRYIPVQLSETVINLPGRSLLITEGCSGLRSMMTLVALGMLCGDLWLRSVWSRVALIAGILPLALLLNGVRIFLTGFLVFFVGPEYGEGTAHIMLGWVVFVVNFGALGAGVWLLARLEGWRSPAEVPA